MSIFDTVIAWWLFAPHFGLRFTAASVLIALIDISGVIVLAMFTLLSPLYLLMKYSK